MIVIMTTKPTESQTIIEWRFNLAEAHNLNIVLICLWAGVK